MDGFEINKVLMAVLLALLIGMVGAKIGHVLVNPLFLTQNAFVIEGVEEETAGGQAAAEEKLEPIEPLLAKANIDNGKSIAKKCIQCHTLAKGEPNKVGPNLYGIVNAKLGHLGDFAYSSALKAKGGEWTYENLNAFLYKPRAFIEGTKMAFAGIKKTQERADLVAYLRTLSDSPASLSQ